jgi:Helix-turn-helix domain
VIKIAEIIRSIFTTKPVSRVLPCMDTICETLQSQRGLMKADAVAELLGLHIKYVYELARKGKLPSFR